MKDSVPCFLKLGRIPDFEGLTELRQLNFEGRIRLVESVTEEISFDREDWNLFDAVFVRPSGGGVLPKELCVRLRPDCLVGSLSVGKNHIEMIERFRVVTMSSGSNARPVAHLTMALTLNISRKIGLALRQMGNGCFDNFGFSACCSPTNKTWTCLGTGHQVRELLPLLVAYGVTRCVLFHPQIQEKHLVNLTGSSNWKSSQDDHPRFSGEFNHSIFMGRNLIQIEGTRDLDYALSQGDFISIHLPLEDQPADGYIRTRGLINSRNIESATRTPFFINPARAEIVDETNMVEAIVRGRIRGYAGDGLNQRAERSGSPGDSPLWSAVVGMPDLPILLTNHIGGADESCYGEWTKVVRRVLEAFGIVPLRESNRPTEKMIPTDGDRIRERTREGSAESETDPTPVPRPKGGS